MPAADFAAVLGIEGKLFGAPPFGFVDGALHRVGQLLLALWHLTI